MLANFDLKNQNFDKKIEFFIFKKIYIIKIEGLHLTKESGMHIAEIRPRSNVVDIDWPPHDRTSIPMES